MVAVVVNERARYQVVARTVPVVLEAQAEVRTVPSLDAVVGSGEERTA